jgi:hypothetical protein
MIMVTIRLRDPPCKWVLRRIHLDSEGKIDRPLGNPTSHKNVTPPAVPLASGMGYGKTEAGLIVSQMLDRRLIAVASSDWDSTNAGADGDDIGIEDFSGY